MNCWRALTLSQGLCELCGAWVPDVRPARWICNIPRHNCSGSHVFSTCPRCRDDRGLREVAA